MRKLVSLLVLITVCSVNFAQQDPQFSLNHENQLYINPAFAGTNGAICATLLHRNQWMGFDGRPVTNVFNIHGAFGKSTSSKHGLGVSLMQEQIGFEKNFEMNANYAFIMKLDFGTLSLGLSVGMFNKSIAVTDDGWITPDMLAETSSSPYDDAAVPPDQSKIVFDAGFGAFFRTEGGLYAGISSRHLPQTQFKFEGDPVSYLKRHYYLTAGYYWQTPSPEFVVKPALFLKSDGVSTQYDVNMIVEFRKQFWGGVSYRVGDAFIPMAGVNLPLSDNYLRVALAYDVTTSDIKSYSSGSFELVVGYCFTLDIESQRGSYKSVRFL